MNIENFKTTPGAAMLALATLLTSLIANAADTPAPAPAPAAVTTPAPATDPAQAGQTGGRGNRANFQRGNAGGNVTTGGGGGFGINFDDQQRALLQEARQVNGDELRKLNEKLAEAQKEFVKAVVAEKYDEKSVREKADTVGKIQAEIMALNGKAFATVSPSLKPEQRESLEGNVRIGIAIINPTGGFGGGPGNFAAGAGGFGGRGNFGGGPGGDPAAGGGFGGGGRGNFNGGGPGGFGGDPAAAGGGNFRRGGNNGGTGGGNFGGNTRRRGGAPEAPAAPAQ